MQVEATVRHSSSSANNTALKVEQSVIIHAPMSLGPSKTPPNTRYLEVS
jgi:hypothetical protein